MSGLDPAADGDLFDLFVDDTGLLDFETAREEVGNEPDRDASPATDEAYVNDLSDNDDDLSSEAASLIQEEDDLEPGDEDDGITRANGVLSWKVDHSTGDHKLKGFVEQPFLYCKMSSNFP